MDHKHGLMRLNDVSVHDRCLDFLKLNYFSTRVKRGVSHFFFISSNGHLIFNVLSLKVNREVMDYKNMFLSAEHLPCP